MSQLWMYHARCGNGLLYFIRKIINHIYVIYSLFLPRLVTITRFATNEFLLDTIHLPCLPGTQMHSQHFIFGSLMRVLLLQCF